MNPNPILEVDTSGRITYFNQAAREVVTGLGPPAKLRDLLPADLEQILLAIKRTREMRFQREVQVKDTVYLQSISCVEPFETIRLYGIDITRRKHGETAVLQAKEEWERTFEAVPDLIAERDIGAPKTGEFGNPQTRSNGNQQYRSISSANPSGEIGRRE